MDVNFNDCFHKKMDYKKSHMPHHRVQEEAPVFISYVKHDWSFLYVQTGYDNSTLLYILRERQREKFQNQTIHTSIIKNEL